MYVGKVLVNLSEWMGMGKLLGIFLIGGGGGGGGRNFGLLFLQQKREKRKVDSYVKVVRDVEKFLFEKLEFEKFIVSKICDLVVFFVF